MRLNEIPRSLRQELKKRRVRLKGVAERLGTTPKGLYYQLTARERINIALADRIASEVGITLEARLIDEEGDLIQAAPAGLRKYTNLLLWLEADMEISFRLGGPVDGSSKPARQPLNMTFSTLERLASALGRRWEVRILGADPEPEPNEISAPAKTAIAEDSACAPPDSDSGLEEAFHGLLRHLWHEWGSHREGS